MTDNIGPHGKGCKCNSPSTSPDHEAMIITSHYRGDLSRPGSHVYEFLFDGNTKKEAAAQILVNLKTSHPRILETLHHINDSFGKLFTSSLETHTSDMANARYEVIEELAKAFIQEMLDPQSTDSDNPLPPKDL